MSERRGLGPMVAGGVLALNAIALGVGLANHESHTAETAKDGQVTTVSDNGILRTEVVQGTDGKVETLSAQPSGLALEIGVIALADGAIAFGAYRKPKS